MINLLEETLEELAIHGKTPEDVLWVGSRDGCEATTWKEFAEIAKDVNYDNDYGIQHIASDLVVVGKGWWLERQEYDGSEWWAFRTPPKKKKNPVNKIHIYKEDDQ